MKTHRDEAVTEVRAARKELCERFGNNPRRLLTHLREQQRRYRGRIIKDWSELRSASALAETPPKKKVKRR